MHDGNLTGRAGSIKRMRVVAVNLVLAMALLVVAACSEDPATVIDETYDYSGTYVATYATEAWDDARIFNYGGSSIEGLLVITDTTYKLIVGFDIGSGYITRSDEGRLNVYDDYVDFAPDADTVLMSTARGYYDVATDRIKIYYIRDNALWTEYWKSAKPVTAADTTTYIPF